jgi:hypothetical protein
VYASVKYYMSIRMDIDSPVGVASDGWRVGGARRRDCFEVRDSERDNLRREKPHLLSAAADKRWATPGCAARSPTDARSYFAVKAGSVSNRARGEKQNIEKG